MISSLRFFVVFFIAASYVYCAGIPPEVQKARDYCKTSSGVSEQVYTDAEQLKFDWSDRNLQCYSKCIFEKTGVMKEGGRLDMLVFYGMVPETRKEITGKAGLECQDTIDDPDLCKKSIKMYECIFNKVGSKTIFV